MYTAIRKVASCEEEKDTYVLSFLYFLFRYEINARIEGAASTGEFSVMDGVPKANEQLKFLRENMIPLWIKKYSRELDHKQANDLFYFLEQMFNNLHACMVWDNNSAFNTTDVVDFAITMSEECLFFATVAHNVKPPVKILWFEQGTMFDYKRRQKAIRDAVSERFGTLHGSLEPALLLAV